MNTWIDEELGALLTSTFASRETLADPDVARRLALAAAPRRRRWLVPGGVAAAVVLVAGVGIVLGGGGDDGESGVSDLVAPSSGAPDSYAGHRHAARAEAARILTLVSLPTDAEQLDGQPAGGGVGDEGIGPSDPDLTQTAWWRVPATPDEVGAHLREHVPDGFTSTDDAPQGTSIDGYYSMTFTQTASTDPAAYRPASLLLRWKALDGGTVVRADVFTGAYDVRDPGSLLADVTAVGLSRTVGPTGDVLDLAGADKAQLARIVDSFQGLAASMKPPMVALCPAPIPGKEVTDTITFQEAGGSTVVARLKPSCWGQVTVTRDGVRIEPTLDPGDLDAVVTQVLATVGG